MKKTTAGVRTIIFAEGGSPQLRPLTDHLPTSLVPIGGTPLLDAQIQTLLSLGLRDITVIGGYRSAQVEQACRSYPDVQYRFNPEYCRLEPRMNALGSAGNRAAELTLLVRGDLYFSRGLVEDFLASGEDDAFLVNDRGRCVGLYRLTEETASSLRAEAEKGAGDLFSHLEERLLSEGAEAVPVGDRPWSRLSTMEDLARALKAHRRAVEGGLRDPKGAESPDPTREAPTPSAVAASPELALVRGEPVRDGGFSILPRPLLRVFHR